MEAKEITKAAPRTDHSSSPLVSIVTPMYNEAEHLKECIESILAQTYKHWTYTLVDNCSTDDSFAIATEYAKRDSRIRVVRNVSFLPIIKNHNEAIRQMSVASKYCKVVFADDWLVPTCLEEMVSLAEQNPTLGLVGAYTMDGQAVVWTGPKYPCACVAGRDVCRNKLLGGPYVFGTMTCLLVRSDLIRKRQVFFNERNLHADQEACFDILRESDFGFVHQVLSFSRCREESNGSFARDFDSIILGEFVILLRYGPELLEPAEYKKRLKIVRKQYYRALGRSALRLRPKAVREYHQDTLMAFGARIDLWLLMAAIAENVVQNLFEPIKSFKRAWYWWSGTRNGGSSGSVSSS